MQYGPVGVDGKLVGRALCASISVTCEPLPPMPKSIIPQKNRRAAWPPRRASTGAPFVIGNILYIQLGGTDQDYMNKWTRIERNIEADLKTQWPGESLVRVLGVAVWTGNSSYPLYMDDLSFSNSMTTEHNVMGPGVIGHILRNRSTNPTTYAATDRWFHYDQVGSVLSESDNTGALAQTHWQDAFGNTLSGWQTATWGGDQTGWHHNSKEYDGDSQLVYIYQRWYSPELGVFSSSALLPPELEHPFSFVESHPTGFVDVNGRTKGGTTGIFPSNFPQQLPGESKREWGERAKKLEKCDKDMSQKAREQWRKAIKTLRDTKDRPNTGRGGGRGRAGYLNLSGSANGAAGIGVAIGSGLAIGFAANRAIVSKQRQYEASSGESLNNIAEYTWSRCNTACRASSTSGTGFTACMDSCTGN